MRNLISTHGHAFLDYLLAFTLLIAPWFFDFAEDSTGKTLCFLAGGLIVVMNFFSKHELGIVRLIPMSFHLNMDVLFGVILILCVFLFEMSYPAYVLMALGGFITLGGALYTKPYMKKHQPPIEIKDVIERD